MPYAKDSYTGDSSTTDFVISFPYIEASHVVVKVDGITKTNPDDYTFTTDPQKIRFSTAPASGAIVLLVRSTSQTARLVDYQSGAILSEEILDNDSLQAFYLTQEVWDIAEEGSIAVGTTTTSAAGGNASVVNAGTSTNAILNFTIPRGPTGPTGATGAQGPTGTAAVAIGGNVDLNTYTTNGYFHQNSNANATSGSNYPVALAGMLSVQAKSNMVYQHYQTYNGGGSYQRTKYNSTWYAWDKIRDSGNDAAIASQAEAEAGTNNTKGMTPLRVKQANAVAGSVGATQLNVTGNGTTSQFLRSDGDGSFTWAVPNGVTAVTINNTTTSGTVAPVRSVSLSGSITGSTLTLTLTKTMTADGGGGE